MGPKLQSSAKVQLKFWLAAVKGERNFISAVMLKLQQVFDCCAQHIVYLCTNSGFGDADQKAIPGYL